MEIMNTIQKIVSSGLAFIVYFALPVFIFVKAIRGKKLPANHYTPVDDILSGKVTDPEDDDGEGKTNY